MVWAALLGGRSPNWLNVGVLGFGVIVVVPLLSRGQVESLSANLSTVSAARDSAIAALNTSFDAQLGAAAAAVDARLDAVPEHTGIPNMVHGADL